MFGNPVDARHWNENSPFVLAKRNRTSIRSVRVVHLFQLWQRDEFGFDKGAAELHRQLQC